MSNLAASVTNPTLKAAVSAGRGPIPSVILLPPQVAPVASPSGALIYLDLADGIVKIKYSDGSILELAP